MIELLAWHITAYIPMCFKPPPAPKKVVLLCCFYILSFFLVLFAVVITPFKFYSLYCMILKLSL